ncbi:hypothetical protein CRYUN_Cryun21dG0076400 [Craigia yunnanensis]
MTNPLGTVIVDYLYFCLFYFIFVSMEAGRILYIGIPWTPGRPRPPPPPLLPNFPRSIMSCSIQQGSYKGPKPTRDWIADWVSRNDAAVRSLPIYVGGASLLAVLFNRAVSGISPVADASSSQSRADLLTLGLAVTNILTGLVDPQGVECQAIYFHLPKSVVSEIFWAWKSLSAVTCCRSLVIVYDCQCIVQIGVAAKSRNDGEPFTVDAAKLIQGSLCQGVLKSGACKLLLSGFSITLLCCSYSSDLCGKSILQDSHYSIQFLAESYLANLSLYPGRSELPFLPSNTQAVILQPSGDSGIAILGGYTIRGFTTSDQVSQAVMFLGTEGRRYPDAGPYMLPCN